MKQKKRDIHGVILLDKPSGMSSNAALQKVRHHFGAKKAGHTGSLDPLATGVLPICLGQATKVSEYFLHSSKRYLAKLRLGQTTDTYDSEGKLQEERAVDISDTQLDASLDQFRGEILQVPPMYSALKKDGQPLYKLARQGIEVQREARTMQVHELTCTRLSETELQLDIHCSSGFYVRSLVHDLGQELGCGAHMSGLRRTEVKGVGLDQCLSLEDLLNSELIDVLLPIDTLLETFPKLEIRNEQVERLKMGQAVHTDLSASSQLQRIYDEAGSLFAIGEVRANGQLKTHKIFVLD